MTTSPPRVSVVIPSLNRADRLVRLLRALDLQTEAEPFEVVVADDGSVDETAERAGRAANEVSYPLQVVVSRVRTGAGPARNRGWRAARGQIIAFVDDDCVPEPRWLALLVSALDSADVAVGRTQPPADQLDLIGPFSSYMDIDAEDCYPTCNIGYQRAVLEALDGFDEQRYRLHNGEDTDLGLRARKAGFRSTYVGEAVVYHDVRPSEFVPYLKRVRNREALVALVARHPEARRLVSVGWWLRPSDKAVPVVWAAILGLAAKPRSKGIRGLAAGAGAMYLWQFRHSYYRPRSHRELLAAVPLGFVADTWSMVVMIRGSIRYRTIFL